MNSVFYDMIDQLMKVYIEDVVVKFAVILDHLGHLTIAFERIGKHKLNIDLLKCAFRIKVGNILGFLVHKWGIKMVKNKAKAIIKAWPSKTKEKLQQLLNQINFLWRFISNMARQTYSFRPLLKLYDEEAFEWKLEHCVVFDKIKNYLSHTLVFIPLGPHYPLLMYNSVATISLGVYWPKRMNKILSRSSTILVGL